MLVLSLFVCEAPHALWLPQDKNVGKFLRIQQKTPHDLPPAFKIGRREAGGVRIHSIFLTAIGQLHQSVF